jgi:hypothetical protein
MKYINDEIIDAEEDETEQDIEIDIMLSQLISE